MPCKTDYDFFLGANTPHGFVSRFDALGGPEGGWRLWVIKGAPGSGKSTLMKQVREAMRPYCKEIHNIHCSSDESSLDGVVFPEYRLAIADGTPPHAIEPRFPGAYENVVSVCDCWDKAELYRRREEIFALSRRCGALHTAAVARLRAAESLYEEGRATLRDRLDVAALVRDAAALAEKLLPAKGGDGSETIRLLSAVTNRGNLAYTETANALAKKIWAVRDDWGLAAPVILAAFRRRALACGYHILVCVDPLRDGVCQHVFVPELSLGVVTLGAAMPLELKPGRTIRLERFLAKGALSENRHKLSFLRRNAVELTELAAAEIARAKATHDLLEAQYTPTMDFEAVSALAVQTAEEILAAAKER